MNKSKKKEKSSKCKWYYVCPIKYFTEKGLIDKKWVNNFCLIGNKNCVRYKMEEKGQYHPDNMLPNGKIDLRLPEHI
ncbi:MAG: uracil-DNA glycosylase [Promethearchaeota archaeon]